MRRLDAQYKKNFMDCYWFMKKKRTFYPLLILFTIVQSMSYNCLVDIPLLLLLVGLFAIYMHRKSVPMFYTLSALFFVYFVQLVLLTKILWGILHRVPLVRKHLYGSDNAAARNLVSALFGRTHEDDPELGQ